MVGQKHELATTVLKDPRWAAVAERDQKADGKFFFAVRTTGVYCRPSCGARTPRPENVVFFLTPDEAEKAGFRPCRRCHPLLPSEGERHAEWVVALCRLIETADTMPGLQTLADTAGISKYHLQRRFKAATGLSPRAYGMAHRAQKVRDSLSAGSHVTETIYAAGYSSSGRFYADADQMLGMTPGSFRKGGTNVEIRFAVGECSLGAILVAASGRGVCAISLGDDPDKLVRDLQDQFSHANFVGGDAGFEQMVARVVGFVEQPGLGLDLPLDVRGTVFQQRVWQALREIPPGSTTTYSELARRIDAPRAVRAVAGACAANLLAVAIPCHRVLRLDGSLSGYRWGVERKRALLLREQGSADEA